MEENRIDNNENFDGTEENGGSGKLIGLIVAAGAGAFALGQTVGGKIGTPVSAAKKFHAKRKQKKAEKELEKLKKEKEKYEKKLADLSASQPVKEETPAAEETK